MSRIGEICIAKCEAENGKIIVMVLLFIFHQILKENQPINSRELSCLHRNQICFRTRNLQKLPMIFSGNFNVDFSDDKSKLLVDFLKSTFNFNRSNDPSKSTTKCETTREGVFVDI